MTTTAAEAMTSGIQFRSRAGVDAINSGPSLTTRILHPLLKKQSRTSEMGAESDGEGPRADERVGGWRWAPKKDTIRNISCIHGERAASKFVSEPKQLTRQIAR